MATFKHISSKNADYGAAEAYLTFEHDEFTMKPTLDENGRLILRKDYRISALNCGGEDFAIACMRSNLQYGKNQKREYWAKRKGQAKLDKVNALITANGITPRNTKFETDKEKLRFPLRASPGSCYSRE